MPCSKTQPVGIAVARRSSVRLTRTRQCSRFSSATPVASFSIRKTTFQSRGSWFSMMGLFVNDRPQARNRSPFEARQIGDQRLTSPPAIVLYIRHPR